MKPVLMFLSFLMMNVFTADLALSRDLGDSSGREATEQEKEYFCRVFTNPQNFSFSNFGGVSAFYDFDMQTCRKTTIFTAGHNLDGWPEVRGTVTISSFFDLNSFRCFVSYRDIPNINQVPRHPYISGATCR